MIAFLTGIVAAKGTGFVVLDVAGVGYQLNMPTGSLASLPPEGGRATIHTHLHVREDELSLFGFADDTEKSAFELLITVSGVGPKVALATLSALSPDALAAAIAADDVALISSVPGIGKKTAQRIILDLSEKFDVEVLRGGIGGRGSGASGSAASEARDALQVMGFSAAEIVAAMKGVPDGAETQYVLQWALKRLGGGR
ncbi:MAG: Holliday junction branch migration protein RuvA [Actinobacteria bacterium HGW-Actinobacteria-7]|nr:MAG: Holliday junction branch migration protein RuvA [Actinobacteria bacterium HGW-Actinobacteria-7]